MNSAWTFKDIVVTVKAQLCYGHSYRHQEKASQCSREVGTFSATSTPTSSSLSRIRFQNHPKPVICFTVRWVKSQIFNSRFYKWKQSLKGFKKWPCSCYVTDARTNAPTPQRSVAICQVFYLPAQTVRKAVELCGIWNSCFTNCAGKGSVLKLQTYQRGLQRMNSINIFRKIDDLFRNLRTHTCTSRLLPGWFRVSNRKLLPWLSESFETLRYFETYQSTCSGVAEDATLPTP
jgi:hypothetical protein